MGCFPLSAPKVYTGPSYSQASYVPTSQAAYYPNSGVGGAIVTPTTVLQPMNPNAMMSGNVIIGGTMMGGGISTQVYRRRVNNIWVGMHIIIFTIHLYTYIINYNRCSI